MAILKNTTIDDTGNLQLPVGTTAQRPTPAAGQFRYNTTTNGVEVYTGGVNLWQPAAARGVRAAGGTVYDVDVEGTTYRVHVFTSTGNSTFTVSRPGTVEYLIVAGGGGGGSDNGGAGGGGGVLTGTTSVTPQNYTITVGAGSTATTISNNDAQQNGQNSSAFGITVTGGGFGASGNAGLRPPGRGATGGGGEGETQNSAQRTGATPIVSGQGFAGGDGSTGGGGGGGGAGQAGSNASGTTGGNGGNGFQSSITGTSRRYGSGGGGGSQNSGVGGGSGGTSNGGGNGATTSGGGTNTSTGGDGQNGFGGGGGGSSSTGARGGFGGSGTVIIRYAFQRKV